MFSFVLQGRFSNLVQCIPITLQTFSSVIYVCFRKTLFVPRVYLPSREHSESNPRVGVIFCAAPTQGRRSTDNSLSGKPRVPLVHAVRPPGHKAVRAVLGIVLNRKSDGMESPGHLYPKAYSYNCSERVFIYLILYCVQYSVHLCINCNFTDFQTFTRNISCKSSFECTSVKLIIVYCREHKPTHIHASKRVAAAAHCIYNVYYIQVFRCIYEAVQVFIKY